MPDGPLLETLAERDRRETAAPRLRLVAPGWVDVVLVTEGTYPHSHGGVSVWCDQLVTGLSDRTFRVVALTAFGHQQTVYELPEHAPELLTIGLWDGSVSYQPPGRRDIAPLARHLAALLVKPEDDVGGFLDFVEQVVPCSNAEVAYQLRFGELLRALDAELRDQARTGQTDGNLRDVRIADLVKVADMLDHLLRPLAADLGAADVYHASSNGLAALSCIVARRRHGGRFLLTEHGIYLRERYLELRRMSLAKPAKALLVRFHRLVSAAAYAEAAVIAPGSLWNQRWESRFGARRSQLRTIYNGIDPDEFPPTGVHPSKVVSWLGRIDPIKDIDTLIRSFRIVCDTIPDARLKLYGRTPRGNEGYKAEMEALIAQLGLEGNVTFEGGVEESADAYADAQIAVLSSISEGFPYSLIESMACGLPAVATGVGGVSEALTDVGLVVLPRAPDLLGPAILELLKDPERCQELGRQARQRVLEHFTLARCLDGFRALYQQLQDEVDRDRHRRLALGHRGKGASHNGNGNGHGHDGAPSHLGLPTHDGLPSPDGNGLDHSGTPGHDGNGHGPGVHGPPPGGNGHGNGNGAPAASHGGNGAPRKVSYVVTSLPRGGGAPSPAAALDPAAAAVGDPAAPATPSRPPLAPADHEALVAAVGGQEAMQVAVDVDEVAATLESVGITDEVAVQRFRSPDVFDLAERVWDLQQRPGGAGRPPQPPEPPEPPRPEPVLPSIQGSLARGIAYVLPALTVGAASLRGAAQVALLAASALGWGLAQGGGVLAYTVINRLGVKRGLGPLRNGFVAGATAVAASGVAIGVATTPTAGAAFALPLLHLMAACALVMAGRTKVLLALMAPVTAVSAALVAFPDADAGRLLAVTSILTVAVSLALVARELTIGGRSAGKRTLQRDDWIGAVPMVACGWLSAGFALLSVRALGHVEGLTDMQSRVWLLLALPLWIIVVSSEWLLIRMRRSLRVLLHTTATVPAFRARGRWIVTCWLAGAAVVLQLSVLVVMAISGTPALAAWQVSTVFFYASMALLGVTVLCTASRTTPAVVVLAVATTLLSLVTFSASAPFGATDHTAALVLCAAAAMSMCVVATRTLVDPGSHR